ncbi:CLUMA_CG020869, isoform B [Clunio marinus]|uniref:glutathione transferase n=1 Tax=Clunio marinus TaxID=568069 RepID=A0A1J1JAJ6_9DIPT|nr:CLUMA_CG020869, isoform B [Clunio marinus]
MAYKLFYFNITALGEPIRFLLNYGNIKFEDVRIEAADWPKFKPLMPLGQGPVLEVDGKKLHQSTAICRFLATKMGLAGSNEMENYEIDSAVETVNDLRAKIAAVHYEPNAKIQEEKRKNLNSETIPFYLKKLEEMAKENQGHLALKRRTWADLYFVALGNRNIHRNGTLNMQILSSTPITLIVNYSDVTWVNCHINPLCDVTVKALMLDHTNHYIFAPMATLFDDLVGFSKSNFITPNMISFFHVFVAILAGRLIALDSLGYRRLGVVLFQFRTFLDDLDGHVARVKRHIRGERSEIGTTGYYVDGICDGFGCIALMIGVFVFLKNNPPRRGYTQLQPIIPIADPKSSESGVIYKAKVTTKKVSRKVGYFTAQLLCSSTAWNRYIAYYQDILEKNDVTPAQFVRQNYVMKSTWFFAIIWLWRIINVHALLHFLLLSIFCDKLWDYLKMTQYICFVFLLTIVCATELHLWEAQNFVFKTLVVANLGG